ncbi:MAG TPA: hypothetical protein VK911_01290, partial [Vicinamibacterales bacterium]|nr:hypothetical protein [Vicinamibacterales bacterium]
MREKEEANRLRRLSAVVRFVAQMGETAGSRGVADARQGERDLIESLVQAMAVWHDLDARGYRRGLDGVYELAVSLPGAVVSGDPRTMEVGEVVSPGAGCRLTSLTDMEQLGWHGQQGEMLLLPVSAGGTIRWILAIPGGVEREVEGLLLLVCRTAGGVIEQMDAARGREVESRLRRRMTLGRASFQARTRGLVEEMTQLTGAAAARLSVRAGGRRGLTL